MSLLAGKVTAITGSSRGIGRACAVEAAKHGAQLVLHYLGDEATTKEAESLKKEVEALGAQAVIIPGDIAKQETAVQIVKAAVDAFGRLDVLVSNAGICPFHSFLDMPPEIWEKTRSVNLDGSFFVVQAAAKQMEKQTPQGGAIVAVSSISALVGGEMQTHYTPTKAGVLSLMQSCAVALGKYNIRCNAVLPGTIATDINKEDLSDVKKREYMESRTCLGRLGVPEDLAGPVVFLASDMARYVTGASLLVDGGLFVNLQ
ncbi:3-oxoacyl-(acyl-carrier) reductase [Rhizoctonia solani AG-3 Rhs1AP]|uniref:3-oxoacyl-(Acyl-carrier) reductase n=2 Tax=Rhizoctonia solani AG-3 TaxID=1086053 RepID=A0A074S8Q2_9AGAM|nr:3-oxoacyl-(acyl-carrier) reductase [Rhizoctonia solani AG-3 Rhs1AP]KEP55756.1 3-oxoacyl-(acyl-carrier) reductase [Rhizoctonia solani 123E]